MAGLNSGLDHPPMKGSKKNSLVANINKRRKAGTSRSKKNSTVSKEAFARMKKGWKQSASSSARAVSKRKNASKSEA